MSSSNNYGVEISMNFTSFEKVNKDYQSILKRLSSEGQIKVGMGINLDQFNKIKESFKEVVNQKIIFDTSGAKTEIKTLKNSAGELINVINKFNNVGEFLSTSYSSSSSAKLESQIGIYKELNKLQTTEFNLKKQMTTAEGVHYNELNEQLQITRQLQQYTGKMLSSNDLVSEKLNNELLQKRLDLKNKLNANISKVDEKTNQSQLQAEIKVSEQYEAKLKEIEAIKLRLTQKTNLSLSDGQLNNSTYNNLKNQISKLDVNSSKENIDRITESVNNLGKSSDRVLKLTNEINKYKKAIEDIKANSSDSLGVNGNIDKLNKFNTSLENSNSILNKLKKNSQSVSNTKFNESMVNLGSSFGDLKNGVDLAEKQKKYIQEGVDLYNKSEKDKTKKLQEEINARIKLEQNYSDLWNKLLNTKSRSDKTQATNELQSAGGLLGNLKDSGVYSENYIKKLQTQFNSLNLNTPIEKIKEFKNQLQLLSGGNENGIVKLSRNIDNFESKLATLKSKYKGLVPDAELNQFENLLNKLKIKLDNMKNNGDIINDNKLKSEIDNVTKSYEKLNLVTKENGFKTGNQDVRNFGEALVNTASKMGVYLSSAIAFQKIFQEFREAVSYTETMDKSITNMKMITGQSTEQVSSMVDEFKKLGAEMHSSNEEVMAGGSELLRAGYNAEESSAMMKASILGSKISGQTTPTVTEQLIAMKNAFNLSADSMEHYVDIMSKLDNSSATSFKEIADAVQRTAFSAQQNGTSLETLMSYITTVSEKTRKPAETIGEAFKTIYSRYSNIKLGNLDEDGKSINDVEKALARVDIKIRDNKNSFRDFDDVLQEFMTKYKQGGMSQVDFLAGVNALSGVRQKESLLALVENMDALNKHQEDVANSAGSASKMMEEAYDGSIDAKLNDMKRSFEELYETILNSKSLGTGLDVITNGVKLLGLTLSHLPTTIMAITGIFTIFNSKLRENTQSIMNIIPFFDKLNAKIIQQGEKWKASSIQNQLYASNLRKSISSMQMAGESTSGLGVKLALLNVKIATARVGMVALRFATMAMQTVMTMGMSFAITGIITLLDYWINRNEKLSESNKQLMDSVKSNQETVASTKKLLEQKEQLEAQLQQSNITDEESVNLKNQLLDVEKQIANILPESVSGYTKQGEAISANNTLIEKQLDLKNKSIAIDSKNVLGQSKSYGLYNAIRENEEENMKRFNEAKENGEKNWKMSIIDENGDYMGETLSNVDLDVFKRMSNSLKDVESEISKTQQALLTLFNQGYTAKQISSELGISTNDISSAMKDLDFSDKQVEDSLNGVAISLDSVNKKTKDATNKTKDLEKNWKAIRKYSDDVNVETTQKTYSESIESVKQLTGWITSMNSENGYTSDIMLEILKVYPQMATYISDTAKVQEELNKKIAEEGDAQKKAYLDLMSKDTDFYDSQIKGTDEWKNIVAKNFELVGKINEDYYKTNADNMKNDLSNANDLAKARASLEINLIQALASAWSKYYSTLASLTQNNVKAYDGYGQLNTNTNPLTEEDYNNMGGMDAFGKSLEQMNAERVANNKTMTDMQQGLNNSYQAYADGMAELSNIGVNIDFKMPETIGSNITDNAEKTKEAVDYSVQSLESLRDAYQRLNSVIDKTQHELDILDKREQSAYGYNKTDLMKQKIQFLEKERDLTNQLANTYRSEAQSQRNNLSSQGVSFDSDGLINNYNEILEAMRSSANSMSSYDDASKKAKENAIENVKQLKESMDDYTNTTIKGLHSAESSWEDLSNTIKDQYKEIVQLTATAEEKVSDIIQKEIEKRYDKRKEALEKQKQLYEDSYKDEDYEDSKAELEDKIQTIGQDLMSAMKSQDQASIRDLQKQKADAIKELNDLVTDKERENAGGVFDKALEDLDTQKEDMLKTENLTEMVTKAMQSGFINVNGEIINLSDSMNTFLKESVVGTANLKLQMDELATSISNGVASLKDLGTYSGFLNSSNLVSNTLSQTGLSGANNVLYTKNSNSNVTYKAGDVYIKGSVTEEVYPKLVAQMQDIADGAVNKFVKYVNGNS